MQTETKIPQPRTCWWKSHTLPGMILVPTVPLGANVERLCRTAKIQRWLSVYRRGPGSHHRPPPWLVLPQLGTQGPQSLPVGKQNTWFQDLAIMWTHRSVFREVGKEGRWTHLSGEWWSPLVLNSSCWLWTITMDSQAEEIQDPSCI